MTGNRGQFAKGQSGNPKGRPARSAAPVASPFDVIVEKTLTVTRNGVEREITMEEALQHRTYQDALAGKRMARREVLRWIEKREAWRAVLPRMPTSRPMTLLVGHCQRKVGLPNGREGGLLNLMPNPASSATSKRALSLSAWR